MEESFGNLGLSSIVEVDPSLQEEGEKAHKYYNYSNMNDK
jgi:hypothetical protein